MENLKTLLEQWKSDSLLFIPKLVLALLVVLIFYFIAKFIKSYSLRFYSKLFKGSSYLASSISIGIYIFFLASGIFIALEILGLENTLAKLIAGAGVIGIIAGFALKDIASNAFAGFLLNIHRPFTVGDWVSINSNFGTIQEIGLITTTIKNTTGQQIFVPNQVVYNTTFINFSTYRKRRVVLQSGVSYGDDLDFVKKTALETVKELAGIVKEDTIDFYYTEIGSSTYNFEVRFWINFEQQSDYLAARSNVIMKIKDRFEKENISIAYAVMTLDFGVKGGVNVFDKPLQINSGK